MAVTPAAPPIPEMMPRARPKAPLPPLTAPDLAADKAAADTDGDGGFSLWGDDGFTFGDLIDVVNPLHHFPGVSTLYHYFTDDDIGIVPNLAGGMLFGGVVGLASSAFNQLLKETTGHTLGGHAIALFLGPSKGAGEKPIRIAEFFEPGTAPAPSVSRPEEPAPIPRAPTHVAVLRSYRPGAPSGGGSPLQPTPGIPVAKNPSREIAAAGQDAVLTQAGFVPPSPIFTAPRPRAVLRRPPPAATVAAMPPPAAPSAAMSPSDALGRAGFQPAMFQPAVPAATEKAAEPGPWIAREMMHNLDLYRQASQPPAARRPTLDRRE